MMMMKQLKSLSLRGCYSTPTGRLLKSTTVLGRSRCYNAKAAAGTTPTKKEKAEEGGFARAYYNGHQHRPEGEAEEEEDEGLTVSGISRPLCDILKDLNSKVPDSLIKVLRSQDGGFSTKYIPWHIVNRIMNLHAPEWSGEVRSITYSADGNSVSVVYRVTIYGIDAEGNIYTYVFGCLEKIYRESIGTAPIKAPIKDTSFGDPVQKAEAMAFRRACARLGLGLHLYHEDL